MFDRVVLVDIMSGMMILAVVIDFTAALVDMYFTVMLVTITIAAAILNMMTVNVGNDFLCAIHAGTIVIYATYMTGDFISLSQFMHGSGIE